MAVFLFYKSQYRFNSFFTFLFKVTSYMTFSVLISSAFSRPFQHVKRRENTEISPRHLCATCMKNGERAAQTHLLHVMRILNMICVCVCVCVCE